MLGSCASPYVPPLDSWCRKDECDDPKAEEELDEDLLREKQADYQQRADEIIQEYLDQYAALEERAYDECVKCQAEADDAYIEAFEKMLAGLAPVTGSMNLERWLEGLGESSASNTAQQTYLDAQADLDAMMVDCPAALIDEYVSVVARAAIFGPLRGLFGAVTFPTAVQNCVDAIESATGDLQAAGDAARAALEVRDQAIWQSMQAHGEMATGADTYPGSDDNPPSQNAKHRWAYETCVSFARHDADEAAAEVRDQAEWAIIALGWEYPEQMFCRPCLENERLEGR